jgi:hypothetical protein
MIVASCAIVINPTIWTAGMRRAAVVSFVLLALGGFASSCTRTKKHSALLLPDQEIIVTSDPRVALEQELLSDVLESYAHDEPPDTQIPVLGTVGNARIGVGPGDLLAGDDLARAPSRWPLVLQAPATVVSKLLRVQVSADLTAAWVSDEVSWRVPVCGRIAVVPLRVTSLYARDGERWASVFEHISYGHEPVASATGLRGLTLRPVVVSRGVADAISRALAPVLSGRQSAALANGADAVALGPRWQDEFRSGSVGTAPIAPMPLVAEDRRVGAIGRDTAAASVGYWVGTLIGETTAGKVRLRGSFVLERRNDTWMIMQSHISSPVDDEELAQRIFGTALQGLNPLRISCQ